MLHQNLSTAPVGAPKVFKKCQIEQMSRHTQDNRDISTKEGWQHVVTGRAKVYDECLVVLKLCLTHSPTELAHALWGNLALSSKSEHQILILHFLKSGRPLPDKLVWGFYGSSLKITLSPSSWHPFTFLQASLWSSCMVYQNLLCSIHHSAVEHIVFVWNWWKFDS